MQIHKKWTNDDLKNLKDDYGILTPAELENKYARKYKDIRAAASRHGIKSKRYSGRRRFWTKDEESMLIEDWKQSSMAKTEFESKYDRTYESIRNKAKELKISRDYHFVSEKQRSIIINEYGDISSKKIAKKINKSCSSVERILHESGIECIGPTIFNRIYSINENYFDNGIDSYNKAYILGFLYADGYNSEDRGRIDVCIQNNDSYILDEFLTEIGSNSKIYYRENKPYNKSYATMSIYNRHMSDTLAGIGMVQSKSLSVEMPNIDDKYFFAFLRGVFDGDGSVILNSNKAERPKIVWSICGGSEQFILTLRQKICDLLNVPNSYIKLEKRENPTILYTITACRITLCLDIFQSMYEQADTLFLKRKFNKIIEWKRRREKYELKRIQGSGKSPEKIILGQTRWSILQ